MQSKKQSSKVFWIHCNKCFVNYIQREQEIYILPCYHVACEKCARKVKQDQVECPMCKKSMEKNLICNTLDCKLKELFHPRPWVLNFEKAFSVVQFQIKQRDHFMEGCRQMSEYNKQLERERDLAKKECREAHQTKKRIAKERKQLEAVLRQLQREKGVSKLMNLSKCNDTMRTVEIPEASDRCTRIIHPTYTGPENEYTFDLPIESNFSKSFIL